MLSGMVVNGAVGIAGVSGGIAGGTIGIGLAWIVLSTKIAQIALEALESQVKRLFPHFSAPAGVPVVTARAVFCLFGSFGATIGTATAAILAAKYLR